MSHSIFSSDRRYKNLFPPRRGSLRSATAWLGIMATALISIVTAVSLQTGLIFAAPAFTEQWTGSTSPYFNFVLNGGSSITSNVADAAASDGKIVQLTLPAFPNSSPNGGPNLQSPILYGFGTFEARMKTVDCSMQPNSGIVNGFFTYLNDGTDQNGNGIKDNSEIDFEWLCAEPNAFWMTMWTDFQDSPLAMKRVYREVDLATGTIRRTCYSEGYGVCTQDLTGSSTEGQPATLTPLTGYNSATAYYTYGFTWLTNRMTWYMYNPSNGQKIILWDYQGPTTRITQRPAAYMFNTWYTTNWSPTGMPNAIEQPNSARYMNIDWATYGVGVPPPTSTPCPSCPTPTNTPPPTATPNCYPQWVSTTSYPTGSLVTRNGNNYQANYQTIGEDPAIHSGGPGSGQPWLTLGACGGATATNTPTGPTATPTKTNTPVPPTNTPTRTNTPGATATPTKTNTPVPPTNTPTKTNTPTGATATPTKTSTPGANLALGKTFTGNTLVNAAYITDGDKSNANNYGGQDQGLQNIVVDLGQNYTLSKVNVWHYYTDGRTYHDVIVQVSTVSDFSTKTTVFNNDTNNSAGQGTGTNAEYAETSGGKTITFTPVSARYVRLWSNGSTANVYNHYVEVEIYQ